RFISANELEPEKLPNSCSLMIYTAPAVPNSHFSDKDLGKESFLLSKKLYNSVNTHRNIESKVIVSYTNMYNRYDAVKTNLNKVVFTVIGRLKISAKKMLHLVASKIEWGYAESNTHSS